MACPTTRLRTCSLSRLLLQTVSETLAAWQRPITTSLARVSTDAQDAQLQRDALNGAGCGRIFEGKISTRKTERPGLAAALDYLRHLPG